MSKDILKIIKAQIAESKADLHAYRPEPFDWVSRSKATADVLIPWLILSAPSLKNYVEDVLNAPVQLRRMWSLIRDHVNLPKEQIEAFDRQLSLDDVLRDSVTGEVVSKVVTKYLMDQNKTL